MQLMMVLWRIFSFHVVGSDRGNFIVIHMCNADSFDGYNSSIYYLN